MAPSRFHSAGKNTPGVAQSAATAREHGKNPTERLRGIIDKSYEYLIRKFADGGGRGTNVKTYTWS